MASKSILRWSQIGGGVVLVGIVLVWPAPRSVVADAPAGARPFVWGRDSLWNALSASFDAARTTGCTLKGTELDHVAAKLEPLGKDRVAATDPALDSLEDAFFKLGVQAAACGAMANDYVGLQGRLRNAIKWQSTAWDLNDRVVRDRLYRALYGSRAAAEEVMLQQGDNVDALLLGSPVGSGAPSAMSNGVELRSGDILVSRGGYPTSALIARGNDYPGNFSHIAFVHVDSATHEISVIEAHIERGVAIGTVEEYLAGKKYRVMLLRLRPDLPALQRDPLLPHRAATTMLSRARTEHIPYDFSMDYADPSRLFCSEVVSASYRDHGVTLWTGLSTISAPGLRNWLSSLGVRQFETQEPSDLEYDPQLSVVAEWRSAPSLFDDHLDNAVTDVMLEGAERGEALTFDWYALPVARLLKGYSWVRGALGGVGSIPEGMAPSAALRNRDYNARHNELKAALRSRADRWQADHGYSPPYWTLVSLMRDGGTGR
jgi:hypothetical protein